jgi:DNA-binding transcriptional ArsR family regulator
MTLQRVVDALSSPLRREVLWLTWNDELTVGQIADHFDVAAPTLSSHLAALRDAELVTMRVDGNFRRYRCNRDALAAVVPLLASEDERWIEADALPEQELARSHREQIVVVSVDVGLDPATAFDAFVDPEQYSEWLGVPVRIDGRHFAATLEWGTEVRGHYDVVAKPDLIAMTWDFDDDAVPVPGRQLVAYLRISATKRGAHVEVHQHAADDVQATFLETAWGMVLGRFADAHAGGHRHSARRAPRRKRSAG